MKKYISICLFSIFFSQSIPSDSFIYNSFNNHGAIGLINMPTARFYDESSYGLTLYNGNPDQKITMTSNPFNWLEASFFYTNIKDKPYCNVSKRSQDKSIASQTAQKLSKAAAIEKGRKNKTSWFGRLSSASTSTVTSKSKVAAPVTKERNGMLVKKRKTKHGDFRKLASGKIQITVNENENPFRFLITLLHEIAHHIAFQKHGFRIAPHGREWKNAFSSIAQPFLIPSIFLRTPSLGKKYLFITKRLFLIFIFLKDIFSPTH